MTIDDSAAGSSIELHAGESLTVRLPENPTTGYHWDVESSNGLELMGSHFEGEGAIGGSGIRAFTFGAGQPGSHALRLRKWREWEGDASTRERFTVTVIVA